MLFRLLFSFLSISFYISSSFAEIPKYDLKQNGVVVAKIQGNVMWGIKYVSNNQTMVAKFSLPPKDVNVSGLQTDMKTIFVLAWNHSSKGVEEVKSFRWWLHFTKDASNSVKLTESTLNYFLNSNESTDSRNATWIINRQLSPNSSMAFECSVISSENQDGDSLMMENVRLQPFDLQSHDFGQNFICPEDSTTTAPATTTPQPTPKPTTTGNWTVTQDNVYTCIRLIADLTLNIEYGTNNGANATVSVRVPVAATVTPGSTCNYNASTGLIEGDEQVIQLRFKIATKPWLLTLNFTRNPVLSHDSSDPKAVVVYYVRLDYVTDRITFPNISEPDQPRTFENHVNKTNGDGSLALFKADSTHYFRCNSDEKNRVTTGFEISTGNLRIESFMPNRTTLMNERVCITDQQNESSDLIPIITGAALAALVLFVLIAYLVGRARARVNTYETI